jgi:DNA-nicking Smr family endonuclease
MGEDDEELMASVLRGEDFDPEAKFQGAPAPPPAAKQQPSRPSRMETDREPDAELDLHGKTQEEAIHMVQNFLLTSYHRKLRHVLIITGKGHNSGAGGPVLREAVYRWLERNGDRFAKTFAWAPARHGGEGAIWVVLR